MKILDDIFNLFSRQNEDMLTIDQPNFSTIQVELGNDLGCEQQIIKCQITNGRLLSSTSKSCELKYGKDTVKRAKSRLAQRRKRGNCSVKTEQERYAKAIGKVIDTIHKKEEEKQYENAL
mgnify:CR=1 FL=1